MKHARLRAAIVGAATITAFIGLMLPGGGSAAAAPATTTKTTAPMTTVRVVKLVNAVPDAHGMVEVLLANGATIGIYAKDKNLVMHRAALDARMITPDNRVGGNCGSSYIYVNYRSDGQPVHMDTGFDVIHAAISYAWHAHIAGGSGTGYDYDYHASGDLAFDSGWHGQHSSHRDYPHAYYAAGVYKGSSFAVLDTGGVCFSAGPYDDRYP